MRALELKIPPVALTLLFAALMWLLARVLPALGLGVPQAVRLVPAIGLVLGGGLIALAGVLAFRRASTTVNPVKPESTTTIVDTGVYRFSRNPMYLGFLLMLAGWAAYLAHVLAVVLLPLFVLYMNVFQIAPEERALKQGFGQAFEQYMRRVRRWL